MISATADPPRATYTGAERDVLGWLSAQRSPRIDRSFVVRGTDFIDVWADAPGYGSELLLFRDPRGGSAMNGSSDRLGLDDGPVIVVEASSNGMDVEHPWYANSGRWWICVPVPASRRQRIVAFVHGETGALIGAAPLLPAADFPVALEALETLALRGAPYQAAGRGSEPADGSAQNDIPTRAPQAAGAEHRVYEATRVVSNVFWSTSFLVGPDPDLGFKGDGHLLLPVLAALDDADVATTPPLDGVAPSHMVTVEPLASFESRAGSFTDCWLITTVRSAATAGATWYCEGPGIVRREIPGCGTGSPPYGAYEVFELVEWARSDADGR